MFEHTFIGLDVHAVNVVGHALNTGTGEISVHTMAADPALVLEWVRRFDPPVKVVYESGPTGFVLARPPAGSGHQLRSGGIFEAAACTWGPGENRSAGRPGSG
jgi:hypothetical protein